MLYIIGLLMVILGFLLKKSKIITALQTMFLIIIMGGNYENPDYYNYKYMFDNGVELFLKGDTREPIYLLINIIGKKLGLDFQQFYFLLMAIAIIALVKIILIYTERPAPVLSLFILYPMLESTIQIRTFLATIVLLKGLTYLFDYNKKYSILKYMVYVMAASLFHISFIFYFILVVIRLFKVKSVIVFVQYCFLAVAFIVPLMPILFTMLMGSSESYFSSMSYLSPAKVLGMAIWQLAGVILVCLICRGKTLSEKLKPKFFSYVCYINIAVCMMIPLYLGGNTFMRLYRNLFLLNYIAITNKRSVLYCPIYILYLICTAVFFNIIASNGYTEVFSAIYEKNILFGM